MKTIQDRSNSEYKISGSWPIQSLRLRKKFANLTDADLKFEVGCEEALFKRLEQKLGKKREELILIMQDEETGRL